MDQLKSYLRIIVSDACNLACVYCHREGRDEVGLTRLTSRNSNFDLRAVLSIANDLAFKKVKLSGGEPLMFPNILSICREFQHSFDDIGFTTNGTIVPSLRRELENDAGKKLSFNLTLNTLRRDRYRLITRADRIQDAMNGLAILIENNFRVKINTVVTRVNIDEMGDMIAYAADLGVDIKFLDLVSLSEIPKEFGYVSVGEIRERVSDLYRIPNDGFTVSGDYWYASVSGIRVLIPNRIYSNECLQCAKNPCAEGLFGMRIYDNYTLSQCFKGPSYVGDIFNIVENIEKIRMNLDTLTFY